MRPGRLSWMTSAVLISALTASGALSACAARAPTGPAWPRSRPRDPDGGESLAPRAAAAAIAAAMSDDERAADRDADERPAAPAQSSPATGSVDRGAQDPAAPQQPDEVQGEDIVIEVED